MRRRGRRAAASSAGSVLAGLCACVVLSCVGGAIYGLTNPDAGKVAATPTAVLHWVTIWSFTGHGDDTSGTFIVPSHWKLNWSCDLASDRGEAYPVLVELVYHAPGDPNLDGMPYSYNAVQTTCQPGSTGGVYVYDGDPATIYAEVTMQTTSATVTLTAWVPQ